MNRKYEFTGETKEFNSRTLKRIRRISDGKLGGWIERELNLSHEGDCWVADEAMVFDSAWIYGSARVFYSAAVYDSARVFDSAQVYDSALVSGSAWVSGSARVFGSAWVSGSARVFGSAQVSGSAHVFIYTLVTGSAKVSGSAVVTRNPIVVTDALPWTVTITDNHVQVGCAQFEINNNLREELIKAGERQGLTDYKLNRALAIIEAALLPES